MTARERAVRLPLVAAAFTALVLAGWGGLQRLGWNLPAPLAGLGGAHGPLMICGFLGTLIGVERAVALRRAWGWAAPALSVVGLALLVAGMAGGPDAWGGIPRLAPLALTAAALVLLVIYGATFRLQPEGFILVMGLGAACLAAGEVLWVAGYPLYRVVPWWEAFLVLTIAGERLEMARMRPPSLAARTWFTVAMALMVGGAALQVAHPVWGLRVMGAGLVLVAAWLLRFDIARHTVRLPGVTRFMALCLLCGYGWMAVAGLITVAWAPALSIGPFYDAALHALFVGFVFSMIFAHAPVILPSVAGLPVAWSNLFYLHAGLLHVSLVVRLIGGLRVMESVRAWGGMLNATAIVLFLGLTAHAVYRGSAQRRRKRRGNRKEAGGGNAVPRTNSLRIHPALSSCARAD